MSLPHDDHDAGVPVRAGGDPRQDARPREKTGLAPMNDEINALVARRGDRTVEDLVPDVEAIMNRHGMLPPGRDGVVRWIAESIAATQARD